MRIVILEGLVPQLNQVVDLRHCGNAEFAVLAGDNQGLVVEIADAADADFPVHAQEVILEFGPELLMADIVDGPSESVGTLDHHPAALIAQV